MSKKRRPRHVIRDSKPRNNQNPRLSAVDLLLKWQSISRNRPPLDAALHDALEDMPASCREDRALLCELVSGSIRWLRLLRLIVDKRLDRPGKIPNLIKLHLIVAAYQLLFLDRIPPFAAVNEAVQGVRGCGAAWASGLANAVLRQLARDIESRSAGAVIAETAKDAGDSLEMLAVTTAHPSWMAKRWACCYGMEKTARICEANNLHPSLVLRANRLRITRDRAMEMLKAEGIPAVCSKVSPDGIILPGFRGNPAEIPCFDRGWFQVQDESAQLVSLILQCRPGHRILDACAGVGGKTTHLAEITGDQAHIDAWDIHGGRLMLLKENADRLGLISISISKTESRPVYDRILVDAPCSGLGVISRHPDIKWNRNPKDIARLAHTQGKILEDMALVLKPGGIMVFAVCTIGPEETTDVIKKFLTQHPAWDIVPAPSSLSWLASEFFTPEGFLRILQQKQGPDGFFAAALKRR